VIFRVAEGPAANEEIKIFTTRPDTLYGATYMVLAPEHNLVDRITTSEQSKLVEEYRLAARKKSDLERTELAKEKTGVFTGAYAVNPVNNSKIPVWISDYVLATYGTGAIMAVPAHDERDFEFATKFRLPIIQVVAPANGNEASKDKAFTDEGISINSGDISGLKTADAKRKIISGLESRVVGKGAVNYRLRDWVFSRQRYWGEPIPVIHCEKCGTVPVPENQLPVTLPDVDRYEPSGTGESPLATISEWLNTKCPKCGGQATRETNTMPQWAGSCWYYLRYLDSHNDKEAWSAEKERQWMNVDLYIGGAEHAVLHLLYSRFWHKVLYDLGLVSTKEPFKKLRHQGTVLAATYQDSMGRYHDVSEVEFRGADPYLVATGEKLHSEIEKMAKSKLNGVNPDDVVAKYGADVLRLYEMFMGEFELPKPWDPRAIEGCSRFLKRVYRIIDEFDTTKAPQDDPNLQARHKTIKKVTNDIEEMKFNTAIAAMMEYINVLSEKGVTKEDLIILVKLIGPFAPHIGDELWERLGGDGFLIQSKWPEWDEELVKDNVITVVVQVNGKLRGEFTAPREATQEQLKEAALNLEKIRQYTQQGTIRKVIVVPGKLVNIVVN